MKQKLFSFYIGFITFLMLAFTFACQKLYKYENLVWDSGNLCSVLIIPLVCGIAAAILTYLILLKRFEKKTDTTATHKEVSFLKFFLVSFISMILLWLPGFLAYYPGICAYDFQPQIYQIANNAYNDHHPLIHTLLIEFFWELGKKIFHSPTAGIAIFTVLQIIFVSASFSFVSTSIAKHFNNRRLGWILTGLFALYPFHFYLSISITKDIPFAMGMILAVTALFLALSNGQNTFKPQKIDFLLLVALILVMLFRNNGKYGVIIYIGALIVLLPFMKGRRILFSRLATYSVLACVIGFICLELLGSYTNATGGDRREMLSLPGQQIARVVHYHAEELPEETIAQIEIVIWPSALYCYRPDIADPVKKDIISWEVLHYPKKYAELYLDLFKQYPDEYVNAFLALYAGFLNPLDVSCNYINAKDGIVPEGLYYIQTVFYDEDMAKFDITQTPVLPFLHKWMEAFANGNTFQKIPLINIILVPGVFLWAYLYLLGFSVYKHGSKNLLPLALVAGYFLTLFAGPTVQLRYLYPVMICLPVAIVFTFCRRRKTENK